jgi:hypothetical protein
MSGPSFIVHALGPAQQSRFDEGLRRVTLALGAAERLAPYSNAS